MIDETSNIDPDRRRFVWPHISVWDEAMQQQLEEEENQKEIEKREEIC